MGYEEMSLWAKVFDLLKNRLGVCNQILGCRYHHSPDNPVRLVCHSGVYVVSFCGDEMVRFRAWDLEALTGACELLDHWQDCMWQLARSGRLVNV